MIRWATLAASVEVILDQPPKEGHGIPTRLDLGEWTPQFGGRMCVWRAIYPRLSANRLRLLKTASSLREFEFRRFSVEESGGPYENLPNGRTRGDEPDLETHNGSTIRRLMETAMKTWNTARINAFASILGAAALLFGIALPAQAADAGYGARAKQVSLTDLNLSTVAGQTAAHERLHQMARRLCAEVQDDLDLSHQSNFVKCVDAATAQTLPHLDAMIRNATAIRTAAISQPQQ
jgi:UrcA family protein